MSEVMGRSISQARVLFPKHVRKTGREKLMGLWRTMGWNKEDDRGAMTSHQSK